MSTGKKRAPAATAAPAGLRYIGAGAAMLDVPARDLSAEEAAQLDVAALLASGLYEPAPEAPETKEITDGTGT